MISAKSKMVKNLILGILTGIVSLGVADWNFFKCFETEKRCPNENVTFWLYTRCVKRTKGRTCVAKIYTGIVRLLSFGLDCV